MAKPISELMITMRAFQESRVLLTAVELDIFSAIGSGATAPEVAATCQTDARATEMLLNALVAVEALSKDGATFHNAQDTSQYLCAASPRNMQPGLMHTVHLWQTWSTLTECVRAGTSVTRPGTEARDQAWTEAFIAAMHNNARSMAAPLADLVGAEGVHRLLDVGGGSGAYSIAFAQANPQLHAEILDVAAVLPITQKYVREAGLEKQITTRAGDLRTDMLGQGYDLILLSAICHMLSPEENQDLFRRCYPALSPQGRLVIREFILNADKTGPKSAALFSLNMLVGTRRGAAYTEQEYTEWLTTAGFSHLTRPQPDGDVLIASPG